MRICIAGSRLITAPSLLEHAMTDALAHGLVVTAVISGGARGVDRLAEDWARAHDLPVRVLKPNWGRLGRGAGLARNLDMVKASQGLVALHCNTPGTLYTVAAARAHDLPVYEYVVKDGAITQIMHPPMNYLSPPED